MEGAALATVLGTVCACALSIASVLRKDSFINLRAFKGWIPEKQSRSSIGNVWSSSLVEQVCLRIGFLLFSMTVARLGTTELAAHQIGGNMMSMSFSFGDGLSVAAITLIGQSLGRKRPDMAKIYGSVCQRLGLVCACVMGFIYFFFGKEIFLLYSDDPVILDYGAMIMRILSVVPVSYTHLDVYKRQLLLGVQELRQAAVHLPCHRLADAEPSGAGGHPL